MYDTLDLKRHVNEAGPTTPVNVTGLDAVPDAGDRFYVLDDIAEAREIADQRQRPQPRATLCRRPDAGLVRKPVRPPAGRAKTCRSLNLILRADVRGSIEAIHKELAKFEHPEVKIRVLQALVGGITEADVTWPTPPTRSSSASTSSPTKRPAPWPISTRSKSAATTSSTADRRHQRCPRRQAQARGASGRAGPRPWSSRSSTISRVGTVAGCQVISRLDRTQLPHPRQPRQPHRSATTRSNRSAARRTTSARSARGWSAASSSPASTTSRKATCWKSTASKKSRGRSLAVGVSGSGIG